MLHVITVVRRRIQLSLQISCVLGHPINPKSGVNNGTRYY